MAALSKVDSNDGLGELLVPMEAARAVRVSTVAVDCSSFVCQRFGAGSVAAGTPWTRVVEDVAQFVVRDVVRASSAAAAGATPSRLALCFDAPPEGDCIEAPTLRLGAGLGARGAVVPAGFGGICSAMQADAAWHAAFNAALFARLARTLVPPAGTTVFIDGLLPMERRAAIALARPASPAVVVCDASRYEITGVALLQWPADTQRAADRLALWVLLAPGPAAVYSASQTALLKLMAQQEFFVVAAGEEGRAGGDPWRRVLFSNAEPLRTEQLVDVYTATTRTRGAAGAIWDMVCTGRGGGSALLMPLIALLVHEFIAPYGDGAEAPALEAVVDLAAQVAYGFCDGMLATSGGSHMDRQQIALDVDKFARLCFHVEHSLRGSRIPDIKIAQQRRAAALDMLDRLYNSHL
jgi:hypothetical protein